MTLLLMYYIGCLAQYTWQHLYVILNSYIFPYWVFMNKYVPVVYCLLSIFNYLNILDTFVGGWDKTDAITTLAVYRFNIVFVFQSFVIICYVNIQVIIISHTS